MFCYYCSRAVTSPCSGSIGCVRGTVRTSLFCSVLGLKRVTQWDISWCLEKPKRLSLLFFACLCEDKFNSNNTNKRQKLAQDFLNSIDQTGELLAMFEDDEIDDVKQERMEVILSFYSYPAEKLWNISYIMNALMPFSCCTLNHCYMFFLLPRWSKEIPFPYFSYSFKCFLISKHTCWEGRLQKGSYGSFCLLCICISFLSKANSIYKHSTHVFHNSIFLFHYLSP